MKTFKVFSSVVFLASLVSGQYNFQPQQQSAKGYEYQQPQKPVPTYLPPTTQPPPPTKNPYESETDVAADGQRPPTDDQDHAPGMPYDFTYAVKDDYGNDFAHRADSDGEVVKGEYRTLLPDGRMQIVKYTADWKNGFNADVSYEGEAQYPEEKPYTQRPYVPPQSTRQPYFPPLTTRQPYVPPPTTRQPYVPPPTARQPYVPQPTPRQPYVPPTTTLRNEFEEDIDSQGLYPSKAPQGYTSTPPPFRCYPGSTDYRCPQPTTTQPPFRCYPGSTDYRCPQPTTERPFSCYPGSSDPRCPPNCYEGSSDPRCPQPTTTQRPFSCYPGSSDPRCPPNCYEGNNDPRCPQPTTTSRPVCYPGSTDYRCPQPTTTQPPRCYPGSYDPRCPQTLRTTTQPPTEPPGLYGAPALPFGVRNNPKFGYSK